MFQKSQIRQTCLLSFLTLIPMATDLTASPTTGELSEAYMGKTFQQLGVKPNSDTHLTWSKKMKNKLKERAHQWDLVAHQYEDHLARTATPKEMQDSSVLPALQRNANKADFICKVFDATLGQGDPSGIKNFKDTPPVTGRHNALVEQQLKCTASPEKHALDVLDADYVAYKFIKHANLYYALGGSQSPVKTVRPSQEWLMNKVLQQAQTAQHTAWKTVSEKTLDELWHDDLVSKLSSASYRNHTHDRQRDKWMTNNNDSLKEAARYAIKPYLQELLRNAIITVPSLQTHLEPYAASNILKSHMDKWQKRLHRSEGKPHILLGHSATKFSEAWVLQNILKTLPDELISSQSPAYKADWALAYAQLKLNYGFETVTPELSLLINFLQQKMNKAKSQDGGQAQVSVTVPNLSAEDLWCYHALSKTMQYAFLHWTLTHQQDGDSYTEKAFELEGNGLKSYVWDKLSLNQRLDHILALKVQKWATRLLTRGHDFLAREGLFGHIFNGLTLEKAPAKS